MRKLRYAGSFDPVTVGHVDLIRRASALCDQLIVAVMINPDKKSVIPVELRTDLIRRACVWPNVKVIAHSGLLVECAKENGVDAVVRGLRPLGDFDSEFSMAQVNRMLSGIETLMLVADDQHSYVSSSIVRQSVAFGGDISALVPEGMADEISAAVRKGIR